MKSPKKSLKILKKRNLVKAFFGAGGHGHQGEATGEREAKSGREGAKSAKRDLEEQEEQPEKADELTSGGRLAVP